MPESYPIPGKLLQRKELLGLTYEQALVSLAVPAFILGVSISAEFIPISLSLTLTALSFVAIGLMVALSPEGQDPFDWAIAKVESIRVADSYYIDAPTVNNRGRGRNLDVVHTGAHLTEYSPAVQEYLDNGKPIHVTEGVMDQETYDQLNEELPDEP